LIHGDDANAFAPTAFDLDRAFRELGDQVAAFAALVHPHFAIQVFQAGLTLNSFVGKILVAFGTAFHFGFSILYGFEFSFICIMLSPQMQLFSTKFYSSIYPIDL
jgi:hypothetical protein